MREFHEPWLQVIMSLVELMRKVRAHKPDVAIVDIRMPPDYSSEGLPAAAVGDLPSRASRRERLKGLSVGRSNGKSPRERSRYG